MVVLAGTPVVAVRFEGRVMVGEAKVKLAVLLEGAVTMAARCSVIVLVRVKVLVEVVVVISSATAASGRRRAARMVGRCILSETGFVSRQASRM